MAKFKHFGMLTNQNCINEEMKNRLNSVRNVLSACLPSKNIKIKLCRAVILSSYTGVKLGLSNYRIWAQGVQE